MAVAGTECRKSWHARKVVAPVTSCGCVQDLKPENLLLDVRGFCKASISSQEKCALGMLFTVANGPEA